MLTEKPAFSGDCTVYNIETESTLGSNHPFSQLLASSLTVNTLPSLGKGGIYSCLFYCKNLVTLQWVPKVYPAPKVYPFLTGVSCGTVTLSLSFRAKTILGSSLYSQLSQLFLSSVSLFSTFAEYSAYRGSGIQAKYLVWYPVHVFISSTFVYFWL